MSRDARIGVEIEKKYVIKKPSTEALWQMDGYECSEILQIYLPSADGRTHRVRSRTRGGVTRYTETEKIRLDRMSSTEIEREIDEETFLRLASQPLEGTRPIRKVRHVFYYLGQCFEMDVYPEWSETAILETELDSREREVAFPDMIEIIKDVTGERAYSNASMSRSFPKELTYL